MGELLVKEPESDEEFQAMWQLNHEVFAGELGQHPRHPDCWLLISSIIKTATGSHGTAVSPPE